VKQALGDDPHVGKEELVWVVDAIGLQLTGVAPGQPMQSHV